VFVEAEPDNASDESGTVISGDLHAVAIVALPAWSSDDIAALVSAFDLGRVRQQMETLGICEMGQSDRAVARLYFSRRCSIVSPNDYFDEAWYLARYPALRQAVQRGDLISGFVHYIKDGLRDGLWPNRCLEAAASVQDAPPARSDIDAAFYLAANQGAACFLAHFPACTALHHYNAYGRFLGYAASPPDAAQPQSVALRIMEMEFDAAYYAQTYLSDPAQARFRADPFGHYAADGIRLGHSPNAWFQEDWYRAFYKEVSDAIAQGWLPCGFYHYLVAGRSEGRLPAYTLQAALEARIPGLTDPSLLTRAACLSKRLAGLTVLPKLDPSAPRRVIWLLLPMLNPDIVYGGYRAALELVAALCRDGHTVRVVTTEEAPNPGYFAWGEKSARIRQAMRTVAVLSLDALAAGTVGPHDLFIAYAVWDLTLCAQLAALTRQTRPILLLQEYEPVFHDNGAQRALCEACYRIPHYPVINSRFLLRYLERHAIGVFGQALPAHEGRDYAVFEHKVNILPAQTEASMLERQNRVLALYARPEAHAGRNLFEMALIALQRLCAAGVFGPEWSFVGLGALSDIPPVPLGGGHALVLKQKLPEDAYRTMMNAIDIGISLMYAPHPSVMPFEFATTGALVVTNVYENRSATELRATCGNIVPCELTIDSLCAAIQKARAAVPAAAARARQAFRPKATSWDQIFSPGFIADIIAANAADTAHEAVVVEFPVPAKARAARTKPASAKPPKRQQARRSMP
jgi:hypothetical protein